MSHDDQSMDRLWRGGLAGSACGSARSVLCGAVQSRSELRACRRVTGKKLSVPVVLESRTESEGTSWAIASIVLAPLAPGDYRVELATDRGSKMFGFGVVAE